MVWFPSQPSLIEEYFEAHSSTKVVTSDRTLQRLQTPKLDRVGRFHLNSHTFLLFFKNNIFHPSGILGVTCCGVCRRLCFACWGTLPPVMPQRSKRSTANTRSTSASGCCSYSEWGGDTEPAGSLVYLTLGWGAMTFRVLLPKLNRILGGGA